MLVTAQTILPFLAARHLLTPEAIVDDDVMVVDASRRNLNLKVMLAHGRPGFFVKQLRSHDPQSVTSLRREGLVYWMAANDQSYEALRDLMPALVEFDAERSILILELIAGGESLFENYRAAGRFPEAAALALGQALGGYHAAASDGIADERYRGAFVQSPPWILSLHQAPASAFPEVSTGNLQLMEIIRRYPEFSRHLDALRSGWRRDKLIHGDIKWDNCVLHWPDGGEASPQLYLVDWELADIGDAAWDVGAVLQGFVADWIMAMRLDPTASASFVLGGLPEHAFEDVQPQLHAFWTAYIERRAFGEDEGPAFLERSVRYGAARMIQSAYEYLQFQPQISANAVCMLQASAEVLERPQQAIEQLFRL